MKTKIKPLKGPLDGTRSEHITANMGIMRYDLFTPIHLLIKQIKVNEKRAVQPQQLERGRNEDE